MNAPARKRRRKSSRAALVLGTIDEDKEEAMARTADRKIAIARRMHDLAVRNQGDELSPAEKEELFAFGKAGDLLAILKSKARRTLGVKAKRRTIS